MENIELWRLCKDISVFQTIMLVLGCDPENMKSTDVNPSSISGYGAVRTALVNAIINSEINARIFQEYSGYNDETIDGTVDLDRTIVSVQSVKEFLRKCDFRPAFFFPDNENPEEYLDPQNPYYAPKLAAAVNAWKVVTGNQNLLEGKTPKQAMLKFLRESAAHYGLTKEDGNPNETGIEDICKIANWRPEGGAAKTPTTPLTQIGHNLDTPKKPQKLRVLEKEKARFVSEEDEIPF